MTRSRAMSVRLSTVPTHRRPGLAAGFFAADGDQVRCGSQVHPALRHRRRAAAGFAQGVLAQEFELIAGRQHHDDALVIDAVQPVARNYG